MAVLPSPRILPRTPCVHLLLWLAPVLTLLLGTPAASAATPTATTLALSSSTVTSGTAITLTATVTAGSLPVTPGQVAFCDAAATYCTDIHRLGTAQLVAGAASLKFIPGAGTHTYKAIFLGTNTATTSTSPAVGLTVTGASASSTSIANVSPTSELSFVSGKGLIPPSGTISFLDTSNANYVLGTGLLASAGSSLAFANGQSCAAGQGATTPVHGDFNGDGIPDLAIASTTTSIITICLAHADGTFTTLTQNASTTDQNPGSLVVGDFNSDGNLDLAVFALNGNSNGGFLTPLLGHGDGTFTAAAATPLYQAYFLQLPVIGDFDGDGVSDLAIIRAGLVNTFIDVYFGNGDGTFAAPTDVTYSTSNSYNGLFAADLNNDGRTDLVVTTHATPSLTLELGSSNRTFTATTQALSAAPTGAIDAADFNGDGIPDLAIASSSSVSILSGNGNGTFTAGVTFAPPSGPQFLAIGDFNGDGDADLAMTLSTANNNVLALTGKGDGTFSSTQVTSTLSSASSLTAADFNSDGFADLAILTNNSVVVLLANPTSASTVTGSILTPVGTGTHQIIASYPGDTNFAASTSGTSALSAQQVTTALTLTPTPTTSTYGQQVTLTATLSPYTAQGHTTNGEPIVFTSHNGTSTLGTGTLANGVATLNLTSLPVGVSTLAVSYSGDTNFLNSASTTTSYTVAAATSTALAITSAGAPVTSAAAGAVITLTATVQAGSTPITPGQIAFCDATASVCSGSHRLGTAQLTSAGTAALKLIPPIGSHRYKAIFLGTTANANSSSSPASLTTTGSYSTSTTLQSSGSPGNYTLAASITTPGLSSPSGAVSFLDAANANQVLSTATLGSGTSTLALTPSTSCPTAQTPSAVAVGDFNADGIPDLASTNASANTLTICLAHTDGTFTTLTQTLPSSNPTSLLAGDLNNDGILDLIVGQGEVQAGVTAYATVMLGTGSGTFTYGSTLQGAYSVTSPVLGDFNGDGNVDLAFIGEYHYDTEIFIFNGNGDGTFTASPASPIAQPMYTFAQVLFAADLNNDGRTDLVFNVEESASLTLELGNSNGTFTEQTLTGTTGSFITGADFNGDGNIDLALIQGASILLLNGNGDGTFTTGTSITPPSTPSFLLTADLNGDGNTDLAAILSGTQNVAIYPGHPDGTFPTAPVSATSPSASVLATADFNADGFADLAVLPSTGTSIAILLAHPTSTAIATANNLAVTGTPTTAHSVNAAYPGDATHAASTSTSVLLYPLPYAGPPIFSPAAGAYTAAQTVTLSSSTPNATIFYTTDGSTPTTASPVYSAPLSITASETLHAIASATNFQTSPAVTSAYIITYSPIITTQPLSQTILAGNTATLSVTASGTAPLTYQWYQGSTLIAGATSAAYTSPALTASTSFSVQVTNASNVPATSQPAIITVLTPPLCTLNVQPTSTALTVLASAQCTDPQGQALTLRLAWGDNSTPLSGTAASLSGSHTYATSGTYTVTLSALDALNLSSTQTLQVSPNNSPVCTLSNMQAQPPTTLNGATVYPVTLTASCTDPQGQPLTSSLTWGDGTTSVATNGTNTHPYTYPNPVNSTGIYNVVLTAKDTSGLSGSSAPQSFQVVPPTMNLAGASSSLPANTMTTAQPNTIPPATQVTFLCTAVSTVLNGQVTTTLPSTYGISCTSPTITLTTTPTPVNVTIQTTGAVTASLHPDKSNFPFFFCGMALPALSLLTLFPLAPGRRRRQFTALSLIFVLCLSLSACGGSFKAPPPTPTPSALYYITILETVVGGSAPTGFIQTSLIVPLNVTP